MSRARSFSLRLDDGSLMSGAVHVWLCVQRRLVRSVEDSPAMAKARSFVAWMAGGKPMLSGSLHF